MKIKKQNRFKKKIVNSLYTLINIFENNNNAIFTENGERKFLKDYFNSLQGKQIIFDVGANIGDYTKILIQLLEKKELPYNIHLFEPTKSCFNELLAKYSKNNNIYLNNFGVSNIEGTAEIYYDAEKSGFSSLYKRDLSAENISLEYSEKINLKTLDKYIDKQKIEKINYLKIDIEGHELKALEGLGNYLNSNFIDLIQFEYGGTNLDAHTTLLQYYEKLENAGFILAKIMKNYIEIRPYNKNFENFQYSNYVAFNKKLIR